MKGVFITFEGIDGSGKTLMHKLLAQDLSAAGYDVLATREPGGSELGRNIRKLLLESALGEVDARTEALLYAADRALHVEKVIRPALAAGKIVLSDRYIDSSFAYQGGGRLLDIEQIKLINYFAIGGLMPDITVYLELAPEIALLRRKGAQDRLEQENIAFFARIAAAYRNLAAAEPERFVTIDAAPEIGTVHQAIRDAVLPRLSGMTEL